MARLKITCVGFNLESQIALQGMLDARVNVTTLVTLPAGASRGVSDYVDLHDLCAQHGIDVIDTRDINSAATLEAIARAEPDYIFTLAWNRLFSRALLDLPRYSVIGSHPSLLPEGRGRAPVPWTIIEGLQQSGVSFFVMNDRADDGELLLQKAFDVPGRAYAYDLYKLVAGNLRDGFIELYQRALTGDLGSAPAAQRASTYRSKRTPDDGHIDFTRSAEQIDRLIRAVSYPYPGAFTYYHDTKLTIWKCRPYTGATRYVALPGQVLARETGALLVQTGTEPLWLEDIVADVEFDLATIRLEQKLSCDSALEIVRLRQEIALLKSGKHD